MGLARAVMGGAVIIGCLAPAAVAGAQEFPWNTTTTSTTTTTTTTTTAATTAPPSTAATTPKPDPDAFAALANQVTQNQALLTQLAGQDAQSTQRLAQLAPEISNTQHKHDDAPAQIARNPAILR